MKRWLIFVVVMSVFVAAGCTRSASKAPADTGNTLATATEEVPFTVATSDASFSGQQTAVAGGFATQTAIAAQAMGGPQATETPAGTEPTAVPPQPTEVTAPTPVPTATATSAPAGSACTSPYTVSAGEWVYSIGRKCNIHPDAIIAANKLRYPYLLYPGDKLILPPNAAPFPGR